MHIFYSVESIKGSVVDPDPGSRAFLTPGSGMGKKLRSGSEMNIPEHISESGTVLKFLDADAVPNPGIFLTLDPGWEKFGSWTRDKHPGSATLIKVRHTR